MQAQFLHGKNNTEGCGQLQTWELPFGFNGHDKANATQHFKTNLKKIHDSGVAITLTMGSWCTQLPVMPEEEWGPEQFGEFVDYFEELRETYFGGSLDGNARTSPVTFRVILVD